MIPRYGDWDQKLRSRGLRVVGVHTPELNFERDVRRLAEFVQRNGITWPVVIDSDYAAWQRFQVEAWPTIVLIDRAGVVRASFIGDDQSTAIETALKRLL